MYSKQNTFTVVVSIAFFFRASEMREFFFNFNVEIALFDVAETDGAKIRKIAVRGKNFIFPYCLRIVLFHNAVSNKLLDARRISHLLMQLACFAPASTPPLDSLT